MQALIILQMAMQWLEIMSELKRIVGNMVRGLILSLGAMQWLGTMSEWKRIVANMAREFI